MTRAPKVDELRDAARFIERTSVEALSEFSRIPIPLAIGNLQYFPRPSPEGRAATRGLAVLRQQVDDAVAALYTLAAAIENKLIVPPALFVSVQPYVDAYHAAPKAGRAQHAAVAEREVPTAREDEAGPDAGETRRRGKQQPPETEKPAD